MICPQSRARTTALPPSAKNRNVYALEPYSARPSYLAPSALAFAYVVARDPEVGVDVQSADVEMLGSAIAIAIAIATTDLAPPELATCSSLPRTRRTRCFLQLWTLQETYTKARDLGHTIPPGPFEFERDDRAAVRTDLGPPLCDRPSSWEFRRYAIGCDHIAAIAIRPRRGPGARVSMRPLAVADGDLKMLAGFREDR